MAGFLRFLVFSAALIAVVVLVVVPLVAGPLLTQMVRDMGMRSDTLEVTVAPFDPGLLLGRARELNVTATNAQLPGATVARLTLTLGGVAFFDRTFTTVSGELRGVSVGTGRASLTINEMGVEGPAEAARATARLSAAESERLVILAADRQGIHIDGVRLTDGQLRVQVRALEVGAALGVRGGALVLEPELGPSVLLVQSAPSDAWRLTEAWVTADGINVRGVVNATRLTRLLVDSGAAR